jgi:hypothetical protein
MAWRGMQPDREAFSLWAPLTFHVHEFGHLFFAFGGTFLAIAGGSLMQLLVPLGAIALMARQRDWFGMTVFGTWLAQSLVDLSVYVGDARALQLDLVGLGIDGGDPNDDSGGTGHDWQYLLMRLGLLQQDTAIAGLVRAAGWLTLWGSVGFAAWLLWRMARGEGPAAPTPPADGPAGGRPPRPSSGDAPRGGYRLR